MLICIMSVCTNRHDRFDLRLRHLAMLTAAGLYGERVGALNFILSSSSAAKKVLSQLKVIARTIYSNPPLHGARIVSEVVGDETMFGEWKEEMEGMAGRIKVC